MTDVITAPLAGTYEPTDTEWRLLDCLRRSPTDREAMAAVHVLARMPIARVVDAVDDVGIDFDTLSFPRN